MSDVLITKLSLFYKVFGDENRLRILFLLKDHSYKVSDLTEQLAISQSAVSHQLQLLRQLDLVKGEKRGKEVYYSLSDHHITTILDDGVEHIEEANRGEKTAVNVR